MDIRPDRYSITLDRSRREWVIAARTAKLIPPELWPVLYSHELPADFPRAGACELSIERWEEVQAWAATLPGWEGGRPALVAVPFLLERRTEAVSSRAR